MRTILITEALLKTLQHFEVIKEFNLQPFEGNEKNFNQFKSVLMTLISEVKNELVSDLNTNDKETLHAQNLDMDSNNEERKNCIRDSERKKETQMDTAASDAKAAEKADLASQKVSNMDTNHEKNGDSDFDSNVDVESLESAGTSNTIVRDAAFQLMDSNEVQDNTKLVYRDNVEMQTHTDRRNQINALIMFKRQQKDEKNVKEYCGRPYIDEHNPLWGQINTCARADAVFIPRNDNKSRYKVTRAAQRFDPIDRVTEGVTTQNITKPECAPICNPDSIGEAVKERLKTMEQHLHLNDRARMHIFQRLKALEDRILFLESISPNIFFRPLPSTGNGAPRNSGGPGLQPIKPALINTPLKLGPDQEVPQMPPPKNDIN
ncbi:MAP3K12-binding inhibitory protein 1 [Trichonephila clavata]|uniref:MAP3K12-binding inhibitory protein 1 n=1 Tax=Trichonephila clavata TaxID=2740835 RepID=A0A8X6I375_TRICU|nr:MAP3K12-binding inhibitory protein 1 [Trichonephila clavata]